MSKIAIIILTIAGINKVQRNKTFLKRIYLKIHRIFTYKSVISVIFLLLYVKKQMANKENKGVNNLLIRKKNK